MSIDDFSNICLKLGNSFLYLAVNRPYCKTVEYVMNMTIKSKISIINKAIYKIRRLGTKLDEIKLASKRQETHLKEGEDE